MNGDGGLGLGLLAKAKGLMRRLRRAKPGPVQRLAEAARASGLVDVAHLLAQDPELARRLDPVEAYLSEPRFRALDPNPIFDARGYLAANPDVAAAGAHPLLHYLETGWRERRAPSPLFDPAWVVSQGEPADEEPLWRWLNHGWRRGVSPHPLIVTELLVACGTDGDPLTSLLRDPALAAARPHPLFDAQWYAAARGPAGEPRLLLHFVTEGARGGASPHPLVDPDWLGPEGMARFVATGAAQSPYFALDWYVAQLPEAEQGAARSEGLAHYARLGWRLGLSPHPLFDPAWYLAQNPDVAAAGLDPLAHYVTQGWREDRAPHPLFEPRWYRDAYDDVREAKAEPLRHFLETGAALGRQPCPEFQPEHYVACAGETARANPVLHYIVNAGSPVGDPHPLFDEVWYCDRVRDDLKPGETGLAHFRRKGRREDLPTCLLFDPALYRARYPDIDAEQADPFLHYCERGGREGRSPHPLFDSRHYLARYPDVAETAGDPLRHYLEHGAREGRSPHLLFEPEHYHAEIQDRSRRAAIARSRPACRAATLVYTSCAFNYLSKARLLARSLRDVHPEVGRVLVLAERVDPAIAAELEEFDEVLFLEDLGIANWEGWAFRHGLVELCTAVKGWVADLLLSRAGVERVLYLDPDTVVLRRLDPALDALEAASIVVTPHQSEPAQTLEAVIDDELATLKVGVFNLGFLGLRADEEGRRFARFWRDRLLEFCYEEPERGLYTDQRWVDLAPGFFQGLTVLRDPGLNLARWNVAHRLVEGVAPNGLTVNGRPLIFFHASGAENGRRALSLAKFAAAAPAYHALVDWYDQHTARLDRAIFQREWSFARYENGAPIPLAHRRAYRDREALRQAHPNPFAAATPAGVLGPVGGEPADRPRARWRRTLSPLERYLEEGAADGLRPNPMFDPRFYLDANPDVLDAGYEPLSHYAERGWREGRRPSPEFDPIAYREQLEGPEAVGDPLAHYLAIGRRRGLRIHRRFDPAYDSRAAEILTRVVGGRRVIAFVSHGAGGGVAAHIDDLAQIAARAGLVAIELAPVGDGLVKLALRMPEAPVALHFALRDQMGDLARTLRELGVVRCHVHHALGWGEALAALLDALQCPVDVTIHDYFFLSPQPFLTDENGVFVGEDLAAAEGVLLSGSLASPRPASLAAHQARSLAILERADRVLSPSADAAARMKATFPKLSVLAAAHPEPPTAAAIQVRPCAPEEPLRILSLGALAVHKGLGNVVACAKIVKRLSLPLTFHVLGEADLRPDEIEGLGLRVAGGYRRSQLPVRIDAVAPHLAWFPNRWPETYSFTLSEAMRAGLPIAAPSLGAAPERLVGRAWTWIRPWDWAPEEWVAFFLDVRKRFVEGRAPEAASCSGAPPAPGADFYSSAYLAPVAPAGDDAAGGLA